MTIPDLGIFFEVFGFILLLFVSGRNPNSQNIVGEQHEPFPFDVFREKIIPDKFVYKSLVCGISLIILGLILQFSFFNL